MEEHTIFEIVVERDGGTTTVTLLVPGYVIDNGDAYVDAHAICDRCGELMFGEEHDLDECGGGSYDYDDSQHPLDLWLEEWVRDHYPGAELGGFGPTGDYLSPHPLGCRALAERLGEKIARDADLSAEDMKNMLTPEQLADAERQAVEWDAERAALEAGKVVPDDAAAAG